MIKLNRATLTAGLMVVALSMASCVKDPGFGTNGGNEGIFDFSTQSKYTLNIKYNVPTGYNVYFEVYTSNPRTIVDGSYKMIDGVRPIDAGYTYDNGIYVSKITIPSYADSIYVYTPFVGVPRLMCAKLTAPGTMITPVEFDSQQPIELKANSSSRATDYSQTTYNKFEVGFMVNRLGYWANEPQMTIDGKRYSNVAGRPQYLEPDRIAISSNILNAITAIIPEGKALHPDINKYIMNGDIQVTEPANVSISVLDEYTSAYSSLGYYCYKTDSPPTKADRSAIEKNTVILFPSVKLISRTNGSLLSGETIKLHYFENGIDKGDKFPAGVSIGWVVYNDAYRYNSKSPSAGGSIGGAALNRGRGTIYSTPALNDNANARYVSLFRRDKFVIMGFDDWFSGLDYNDIIFNVAANPIDAITDQIPEVKPDDNPEYEPKAYASGILAFEDLWPSQGDFDMNDVVVKYASQVTFDKNNNIVSTEDEFELLWSGGTIPSGFAYMLDGLNSADIESITFDGDAAAGASIDNSTKTPIIRLFTDAKTQTGINNTTTAKVVVKTKYKALAKSRFNPAPYNPFIFTADMSNEVHLTNMSPSSKVSQALFGSKDDRSIYGQGVYYITYTGETQMPFAIHLDTGANPNDFKFVIPAEAKKIDVYYPKFSSWVTSKGKDNTDWFMFPIEK